jgi:hypothetical protein
MSAEGKKKIAVELQHAASGVLFNPLTFFCFVPDLFLLKIRPPLTFLRFSIHICKYRIVRTKPNDFEVQ